MIRDWYKNGTGTPPVWALLLEAAKHDPLRAQELEDRLSARWFERWLADREARIAVRSKPPEPTRVMPKPTSTTFRILPDGTLVPEQSE